MPVTLTNREAMNARDGLRLIGELPLDVKTAYRVAKMKGKVTRILEDVEAVRKRLLDTHGKKDDAGKLIERAGQVELANLVGFQADFDALLGETQSVDGVEPITATMLGDRQVTPDTLFLLGPLFDGDA